MGLDLKRLQKVRTAGGKITARCPACAEDNRDRQGNHLVIFEDGRYGCAAVPGDYEHRRRIYQLAGKDTQQNPPAMHEALERKRPRKKVHLPPDFRTIVDAACDRFSDAHIVGLAAIEFGVSPDTIRHCSLVERALGFFPDVTIGGHPCLPNRLGYVYPRGIKIRHPWGEGKPGQRNRPPRFAWATGSATSPWRYATSTHGMPVQRYVITEGESDAIACLDAELESQPGQSPTRIVASPGTAFDPAWSPLFADKDVIIAFDFDKPGQDAANLTARWLKELARSVRIYRP
ncbi:MAG: toprim domain-containing protein [Verrucomicrobiaceae bacterium]|nr:toprim domain-containing protein [Verrucomicrobiaceae bacterium]